MKPKLTFIICSVLLAITGIVMIVFAEQMTQRLWPDADTYALNIGIVLRYLMGATIITTACILFQARKISDVETAKQVLIGMAGVILVSPIFLWGSRKAAFFSVPRVSTTLHFPL